MADIDNLDYMIKDIGGTVIISNNSGYKDGHTRCNGGRFIDDTDVAYEVASEYEQLAVDYVKAHIATNSLDDMKHVTEAIAKGNENAIAELSGKHVVRTTHEPDENHDYHIHKSSNHLIDLDIIKPKNSPIEKACSKGYNL